MAQTKQGTAYNLAWVRVVQSYRKNWLRWAFDPTWRELARIDAAAQARAAYSKENNHGAN